MISGMILTTVPAIKAIFTLMKLWNGHGLMLLKELQFKKYEKITPTEYRKAFYEMHLNNK
jgi:hypothetical protein